MNIKLPVFKKNFVSCFFLLISIFYANVTLANSILKNNFFIKGTYEEAGLILKYTGVIKFFVSSETKSVNDLAFNYKLTSFSIEEVVYEGQSYRGHDLFGITFPYEVLVNMDINSQLIYKDQKQFVKELQLRGNKYEMFSLTDKEKQYFSSLNISFANLDRGFGFKFKLLETLKITKLYSNDLFVSDIIDFIQDNAIEKSKKQNEEEYTRLLTEGNIRLSENNYEQALFSFLKAKKYTATTGFVKDKIAIVDSYLNKSRSKYRWKNNNEEKAVEVSPLLSLKNDLKISASFDSFSKEKTFYKLVDKADDYITKGNYEKAIEILNQSKKYTTNKVVVNNGIVVIEDEIKKGGLKNKVKRSGSEQARIDKERKEKEALFADYKEYSEARKLKKKDIVDKIKKDEILKKTKLKGISPKGKVSNNEKSYSDLLKLGGDYLTKKEFVKSQKAYQEARKKTTNKAAIDKILIAVNKLAAKEKKKTAKKSVPSNLVNRNLKEKSKFKKEKRVSKTENGSFNSKSDEIVVLEATNTSNTDELEKKKKQTTKRVKKVRQKKSEVVSGIKTTREREGNIASVRKNKIEFIASTDVIHAEKKKSRKKRNLLSLRKGFIKYRRDEQAVVDSHDDILIPFGKYKIMYYRAGFARIKLQDSIALKTVECTGKNEEYSWSARVYQNPWFETVINDEGEYVDDMLKKVEIYVVDNVSLLPYEDLSNEIIEAYKDPNPYLGTTRISAHNLWNRKHSDEPEVIKRRAEIARFKAASKLEAYQGADGCREKVANSVREIYEYYEKNGYEVILK